MAKKGKWVKKVKRVKAAWWVEVGMLALALLSAFLLVLEFTVSLTEVEVQLLDFVDLCIALVFLGEFGYKLLMAKKPKKFFMRRWWELLAAIPITTPLTQGLRLLRLLRLVHLVDATTQGEFRTTGRTRRGA